MFICSLLELLKITVTKRLRFEKAQKNSIDATPA